MVLCTQEDCLHDDRWVLRPVACVKRLDTARSVYHEAYAPVPEEAPDCPDPEALLPASGTAVRSDKQEWTCTSPADLSWCA